MSRIDPFGAGLILGLLAGSAEAVWIALVALTGAPWAADVVLAGQVVAATFALEGVDLSVAAFLVVMAAFAGCATGWLVATIWNGLAALHLRVRVQQAAQ